VQYMQQDEQAPIPVRQLSISQISCEDKWTEHNPFVPVPLNIQLKQALIPLCSKYFRSRSEFFEEVAKLITETVRCTWQH
jgi:hypothetical protein